MTFKTNHLFAYFLFFARRTAKIPPHVGQRRDPRSASRIREQNIDYCFSPEKLLKETISFSRSLYYGLMAAAVCLLWKLTDQFATSMLVVTYLLCSYYDVIKSCYNMCSRVKPHWFVVCAVCVLAGTFAWSLVQQLDVVFLTNFTKPH